MDNLEIYNKARKVPNEAKKEIGAGRLKGKTDINPMWRIKLLTELFGMCGFGWKYEITKQWLEHGANDEISAFVNINLYIKMNNEWSDAIPGTGGSAFVAKEKNGLYTSDECFKMALTDAISVSCKALGVGADVYWDKDRTKYDAPIGGSIGSDLGQTISKEEQQKLINAAKNNIKVAKEIMLKYGYTESKAIKKSDYEKICKEIEQAVS